MVLHAFFLCYGSASVLTSFLQYSLAVKPCLVAVLLPQRVFYLDIYSRNSPYQPRVAAWPVPAMPWDDDNALCMESCIRGSCIAVRFWTRWLLASVACKG
jgi:hypothetical protein